MHSRVCICFPGNTRKCRRRVCHYMNIFADTSHHAGLNFSIRLMGKRLDFEIFNPIGMEWTSHGWLVHKAYDYNMETAKQFLQIKPEYALEPSHPLNTIVNETSSYYEIQDHYHSDTSKSVTYDQFMSMEIAVVIASIPDHWESFKQLVRAHPSRPELVCHTGNVGWDQLSVFQDGSVENLLASVKKFPVSHKTNAVFYHQEIPVVPFKPYVGDKKTVTSFLHLLPRRDDYMTLRTLLPEYEFKAYGSGCPDGIMPSLHTMYETMQDSQFILQNKPGGDGFGWNVMCAAMLGRPLLVNYQDYKDKLAGEFLIPDKTCIDIQGSTLTPLVDKIRFFTQSQQYKEMSMNLSAHFTLHVNYEREAEGLKVFFENLH